MIKKVTIYKSELQLVLPFTTSFGTEDIIKRVFITIQDNKGNVGLGEIPTLNDPNYKPESDFYSVVTSLENFIIPSIVKTNRIQEIKNIKDLTSSYKWIKGANFAKSGVEAALWHLLSIQNKKPVYKYFGGKRKNIVSGVSIGAKDLDNVMKRADSAVDAGYTRLKIKIWPGFDTKVVKKLRETYPNIMLQVDANSAYDRSSWKRLKRLDKYRLLLIEQPLASNDIIDHSVISKDIKTPICLDESIISLGDARKAIFLWKNNKIKERLIINIKPPRVSGFMEAIDIAKLCNKEVIPTWCGGMLDSAWGKYMNLSFNSRVELNLPGDHFSPTGNYFKKDILKNNLKSRKGVYNLDESPEIDWKTLDKLTKDKKSYNL